MDQSRVIFHLKTTPSGPLRHPNEAATTTWRLFRAGGDHKLEIVRRLGRRRKTRKVIIGENQAKKWLDTLRQVQISMFPIQQESCDGSFYELRTTGEMCAVVSLGWYNIAPQGAEALDKLIDWLWAFVTPSLDFPADDLGFPLRY